MRLSRLDKRSSTAQLAPSVGAKHVAELGSGIAARFSVLIVQYQSRFSSGWCQAAKLHSFVTCFSPLVCQLQDLKSGFWSKGAMQQMCYKCLKTLNSSCLRFSWSVHFSNANSCVEAWPSVPAIHSSWCSAHSMRWYWASLFASSWPACKTQSIKSILRKLRAIHIP